METTKGVNTQKYIPVFEARPYGARMKLTSTKTLVMINPHASTAEGVDPNYLNKGLRGHEGEEWELVRVLGFSDGGAPKSRIRSIRYTFLNNDGIMTEKYYSTGAKFYSVFDGGNEGFWHVLENRSNRPVMLLIETKSKPVDIRRG